MLVLLGKYFVFFRGHPWKTSTQNRKNTNHLLPCPKMSALAQPFLSLSVRTQHKFASKSADVRIWIPLSPLVRKMSALYKPLPPCWLWMSFIDNFLAVFCLMLYLEQVHNGIALAQLHNCVLSFEKENTLWNTCLNMTYQFRFCKRLGIWQFEVCNN